MRRTDHAPCQGRARCGLGTRYNVNTVASSAKRAYLDAMFRYFDITDHARLPQRFSRENRSVLARLR